MINVGKSAEVLGSAIQDRILGVTLLFAMQKAQEWVLGGCTVFNAW